MARTCWRCIRPSTGPWFVAGQASGISFGGAGDVAVPLFNYYGTGRDVLAVFRPSTSQWFVAGQGSGISFGGAGDIPIAADFDGMGHDELGVYRPSTGEWFVGGHADPFATFGGPVDIPLESPYVYRVTGLSTTGIPASSLYAFNFGVNAAALSAGSGATDHDELARPRVSTTGTSTVVTPPAPAKHHRKHVTAQRRRRAAAGANRLRETFTTRLSLPFRGPWAIAANEDTPACSPEFGSAEETAASTARACSPPPPPRCSACEHAHVGRFWLTGSITTDIIHARYYSSCGRSNPDAAKKCS